MAAAQAEPSVLTGGPWRDRRAAIASLAQQSEADFDFCFQTVQALVPLLEHQRWRTRALAKVALRRIGEEASANAVAGALELLGPCARDVEAEEPAQASEREVEAEHAEHAELDAGSEDLSDRVVADVAIPAQITRPKPMPQPRDAFSTWRSPSSEDFCALSRRSSEDDSSYKAHSISAIEESDTSQPEEPHPSTCEHPPLDDLPISALRAVHIIAARGDVPGSSVPVTLQLRAVRTARRLLANSAGGQPRAAAVSVLGDFGGSGDLAEFRRLGVARDQVLEGFAKGGKKGKDAKGYPGSPGGFPTKGYGKSGGKGEPDAWQMGQMSMKGKAKSPFGDGKAGKAPPFGSSALNASKLRPALLQGFGLKGPSMGKEGLGKDGGKAKGQSAELAWHSMLQQLPPCQDAGMRPLDRSSAGIADMWQSCDAGV
ncbi:ATG18A [Symbiodinium sp. CCMP2592]|nr:ATG18A [Symbiodinium sp. CCMP2592]